MISPDCEREICRENRPAKKSCFDSILESSYIIEIFWLHFGQGLVDGGYSD